MEMAIDYAVTAARTVPASHRSSLFTRLSMEILVTIYTLETLGMNHNFMLGELYKVQERLSAG